MKLLLEFLMTNNHQKPYVLQNEALPFSSLTWFGFGFLSFFFFFNKDDISKEKVGAQQISGCLAENFEESGQDDRKGCDEMSSSSVPVSVGWHVGEEEGVEL